MALIIINITFQNFDYDQCNMTENTMNIKNRHYRSILLTDCPFKLVLE
jgi:hypothetical protein